MAETYFTTGGTGFIGRRLVERLVSSGARVKCLARATSNRRRLEELGVEIVEGDLFSAEALARGVADADFVLHVAGVTRELRPGDFLRANCEGAKSVASACLRVSETSGKTPILVAVSSLACGGPAPKADESAADVEIYAGRRLRRETDVPAPSSPYGRSKLAGELALQEFAAKLPITIVRPPYVFGEGDATSAPLYRMAKRRGAFVLPGWADRFFSFVHVDDLIDVILQSARCGERLTPTSLATTRDRPKECSGVGIYFATSPKPILFSEYGRMIGRAFGRSKTRSFHIPPVAVGVAGLWGELVKRATKKAPPFDWNKAVEALHGPWICSGAKAANELGVEIPDDLEQKFERTARWYEREGLI